MIDRQDQRKIIIGGLDLIVTSTHNIKKFDRKGKPGKFPESDDWQLDFKVQNI